MNDFRIKMLGTRGSVPVEGKNYEKYGGATSCVLVEVANKLIILDAGTGFMSLPEVIGKYTEINLLISHPHIDHMLGIVVCPLFYNKDIKINIYARRIDGRSVKEQITALMSNPIWPVNPNYFLADINYIECNNNFKIGDVEIKCEDGWHPGGSTLFRLEYNGKSLVYATDFEINEISKKRLASFAKHCSLILCDGQYTKEELKTRRGYGHSSWEDSAETALNCFAEKLGIIHHAPLRTDKQLNEMQCELDIKFPGSFFAKINEERTL